MWTEAELKELKRQEQEQWRDMGKAARGEAKAIKAAKTAELRDWKAAAKAERAALRTEERGWKAIERAERFAAKQRWEDEQAAALATKNAAKAAKQYQRELDALNRRAAKDRWQDAPVNGWKGGWQDDAPASWKTKGWQNDAYYYSEPEPAGCWLMLFSVPGFAALALLVLLALFLLAQVATNR